MKGRELGGDLWRSEEELEGLAGEFDAVRERIVGELLEERKRGAGLAVIEGDSTAGWLRCDEGYRCSEGGKGEVRDDSEPREVGWLSGVEASLLELLGERFGLEVDGRVSEVLGYKNGAGLEEVALPLLSSRVVDLEDVELRPGVAVGEGVETGAEKNVLADSVGDGAGEVVFGIAAAGDEMGAHRDREWPLAGGSAELFGVGWAEYWDGDGIVEDDRPVVELVRGAAEGDTERGAGWDCLLHSFNRNGGDGGEEPEECFLKAGALSVLLVALREFWS